MNLTCKTCDEQIHDIVHLTEHHLGEPDDHPILRAQDLSSGERSTLLYIESELVDGQGVLDWDHMNYHDEQNMKLFKIVGMLEVEEEVPHPDEAPQQRVVKFTDAAWDLARDCRQMKANEWIGYEGVDIGDVPSTDE